MLASSQLSPLPLLPGKIYPVKSEIIIHHRLQITCCKSCNQRDNGNRGEPIAVEDYCLATYCWLPPASSRPLLISLRSFHRSSPSRFSIYSLRDMSPTTVPSLRNLHFLTLQIVWFFFLNTIPLLVFVSLISSPNPLSLLLARVYPLWLQPPPPAPFDCICFFFILSSFSLSLPFHLSFSLCVCIMPHSSLSVCLSPSVLPLYPHSTLLFPFHVLALRSSTQEFLSLPPDVCLSFCWLPLPRVSFSPFLIFLYHPRASEY